MKKFIDWRCGTCGRVVSYESEHGDAFRDLKRLYCTLCKAKTEHKRWPSIGEKQ
ncbi:MAG TPA: hypothetical protein VM531_09085 [Sphingomicrobium sp.]|jgi:hypothetical protein|nr:hypothetical protein [Sphingomicrobium sp.]